MLIANSHARLCSPFNGDRPELEKIPLDGAGEKIKSTKSVYNFSQNYTCKKNINTENVGNTQLGEEAKRNGQYILSWTPHQN